MYISVYAFILPSCFATCVLCHIIYESYIIGRRLLVMMANCLRRCLDQFMKCSVGLSVPWWARKLQCQESLRGLVSLQVSLLVSPAVLVTQVYQRFLVVTNPTLDSFIPWTRA